jgi:hypothetical protein
MRKLLITTLVFFSVNIHAINDIALLKWATKNTMAAFNYNALNFKEKLSSLQSEFTTEGWQRYKQALNESGNIDYVIEHNLIVTGQINGTPTINHLTATNSAKEEWQVTIPALVLYLNEYFTVTQEITTQVTVEKMSGSDKYAISDINSSLNKPITISKITPSKPKSCQIS